MELILLGSITSQMKHMDEKSQDRFTKFRYWLTNMITFHEKVTCKVDVKWAADIV